LAEAIAGERIRGSWWGLRKRQEVFTALEAVADSPDVLCRKRLGGKLTFVHRQCWAALVRLADAIGHERLASVRQEHTPSGKHVNVPTPFPTWAPPAVISQAATLSEVEARTRLGAWVS